jgi:hypothetical protein
VRILEAIYPDDEDYDFDNLRYLRRLKYIYPGMLEIEINDLEFPPYTIKFLPAQALGTSPVIEIHYTLDDQHRTLRELGTPIGWIIKPLVSVNFLDGAGEGEGDIFDRNGHIPFVSQWDVDSFNFSGGIPLSSLCEALLERQSTG